jgi:hypothetical protein
MKAAVYRSYGSPDVVTAGEMPALPVIDARYPLTRIADAYRNADAGHEQGNVVVTTED